MKASKTHVLLVAAFLVAGCAATANVKSYLDGYTRSPTCEQEQCNYTIEITACSESGIRPNFDPIHVGKGTHRLHWVITTPGYTFDTSGIAFPGNPGEFTRGTRVTPKASADRGDTACRASGRATVRRITASMSRSR